MNTARAKAYSIKDLHEIAEIESHFAFLKDLFGRYQWEKDVEEDISSDLLIIQHKKESQRLFLSVVGEFNSGKSTFINALLRDNLLEADIIPGTTTSMIVLYYGEEYTVTVTYKDGKSIRYDRSTDAGFCKEIIPQLLTQLTADDQQASEIQFIEIGHPAAALREGITIIDTPGTNADIRWHEDVTRMTIRISSDASLILTPADRPLPDSLIDFVRQNLSDVLDHCVFVVTKWDLVAKKERPRLLSYIRQRITNAFGIEEPVVFTHTPQFVLAEAVPEAKREIPYAGDDYGALLNQSYQAEAQIYATLSQNRVLIQVQRLTSVMESMLTYIAADMDRMVSEYEKKHAALMAAQRKDLQKFTNEMELRYTGAFRQSAESSKQRIANMLEETAKYRKVKILQEFNQCTAKASMTEFRENLNDLLQTSVHTLQTVARTEEPKIADQARAQLGKFWKEFSKWYSELQVLKIPKPPKIDSKDIAIQIDADQISAEIEKVLDQYDSYEAKWGWGAGAAAGAGAGLVFGPLGAAVGFFAGMIAGVTQAEKKFAEYKARARSGLLFALDGVFNSASAAIVSDVSRYIQINGMQIREQIENCCRVYQNSVSDMIAKEESVREELEMNLSALRRDQAEVENRRGRIVDLRAAWKLSGANPQW